MLFRQILTFCIKSGAAARLEVSKKASSPSSLGGISASTPFGQVTVSYTCCTKSGGRFGGSFSSISFSDNTGSGASPSYSNGPSSVSGKTCSPFSLSWFTFDNFSTSSSSGTSCSITCSFSLISKPDGKRLSSSSKEDCDWFSKFSGSSSTNLFSEPWRIELIELVSTSNSYCSNISSVSICTLFTVRDSGPISGKVDLKLSKAESIGSTIT